VIEWDNRLWVRLTSLLLRGIRRHHRKTSRSTVSVTSQNTKSTMGCGGSEETTEGKVETQEVAVVEEAPPEGWVQAMSHRRQALLCLVLTQCVP